MPLVSPPATSLTVPPQLPLQSRHLSENESLHATAGTITSTDSQKIARFTRTPGFRIAQVRCKSFPGSCSPIIPLRGFCHFLVLCRHVHVHILFYFHSSKTIPDLMYFDAILGTWKKLTWNSISVYHKRNWNWFPCLKPCNLGVLPRCTPTLQTSGRHHQNW
jgi:hypothetical protein